MFLSLYSFHFMSNNFLFKRTSLNSLNSVAIFTPLAVLDSLPSIILLSTSLTLVQ